MEEWKVITEFSNYEVSNMGRVRRGNRFIGSKLRHGYIRVCPRKDGQTHYRYVHQLVLEEFVGSCPDGMECRHIDGDPSNNELSNLKWGTHKENCEDTVSHGRTIQGEKAFNHKLTKEDVMNIRQDSRICEVIGEEYNISFQLVSHIKLKKRWGWL